jgi:hypothetical protein
MPGTIAIAQATPITLTQNMTITGPGASALTISGANQFPILQVNNGVSTVSSLTLANGNTSNGGGIANNSTLTVNACVLSGNTATENGGGIFNEGTLTVTNSTFSSNEAEFGGGIDNSETLVVSGSTFNSNTASLEGGGIANISEPGTQGKATVSDSTFFNNTSPDGGAIISFSESGAPTPTALTVSNSTFSNNSAQGIGGAILNVNESTSTTATLTVANSIFTNNTAPSNNGAAILSQNRGGPVTANASTNVFFQNIDTGGGEDDCNGCNPDTNPIGGNPLLLPLGNYGGLTQTMLPLPGSAAICAGVAPTLITPTLSTDQRGVAIPNTTYATTPCFDVGAVQTAYALAFTASPSMTDAGQPLTPNPVVTVSEDGSAFTAASANIAMSAAAGTLNGPTSVGTSTTAGATAGTATFSALNFSTPETNDTLTATLSLNPALTPALSLARVSGEFNIIAGMPATANSSFMLPATAVAGTTVMGTLTLKDQDGNLVQPTSVTFTTTSATAPFSTPTTVMTANGVATIGFSDTKAETVAINVSVGGTQFLSGTVQITPAAPASILKVSGTPQSATVNTQFAAPLVVVIEDKFGNPTPNVAVPPFVAPVTGASAALTTVAETNSNGQASVTATANGTSGSYNVTVTEQNTTATFALTNNAGTPTATNSSFMLPTTAMAGTTAMGTLTLKDQNGNLVQPASVTFTTTSATTAFSTPATVMTANGVVTIGFSDTKAETVTINVSVGGTPFLSGTVQITPAAPASVSKVSGTPQSATVNTQFAAPLVVVIEDKFGNPTPNVPVPQFVAPTTGASAILTTVAETNSNGQASVTATANGTSGSYNVTVTEQNTTATFALTNIAGTQTIAFTQPVSPVTYGVAPTTLAASASSQLPVSFAVTGPAAVNGSVLTITGAGTVAITASQAGDPTFAAATPVMRSLTVSKQPTITSVSASPTVVTPMQAVTLTAAVASTIAGTPTAPSGTVTFFDNGVQLGAAVNVLNGAATLTVPSLPSGATDSITATYSGNGNFLASTSSSSTTITVASLDFSFTNTGTTAYTTAPGAVATYSFGLSPLYGSYAGTVNFTVTGLPAGATASFTPSTVPADSGAIQVVMTVETSSATAYSRNPFGRGIVLALLFLPFAGKHSVRKKMKGRMLLMMLLMAGLTATLTGCGSTSGFLLQNPQTYTLTVTATSGTLEHSEPVTLIVQ